MRKPEGYDNSIAFTGEFETLELGGHICRIKQVNVETTATGKEILALLFDIVGGKNDGFYQRQYTRVTENNPQARWGGVFRQFTEGNSIPFFKGMITSVENSNQGYTWNWDEKSLVGKMFGGIFGEEEYINSNGELKKATKCVQIRSVEQIKKGVEIPPIKKVKQSITGENIPVDYFGNEAMTEMQTGEEMPF